MSSRRIPTTSTKTSKRVVQAGPAFQRGTGFLLSRLGTFAERAWASVLAAHGVTQTEYAAVVVLRQSGPLGPGRLAELVALDERNLVPVVAGLEGRGLVERRVDPGDARRRVVQLSGAGRALGDELERAAPRAQAKFLAGLSKGEQAALNALLQRVFEHHTMRT